ncbi:MAG: tRNA (adenosine(37)-N6)-threonylcarbamoyltransferase complex dimerization subunit type 1 TsaB, partial [Proteobacteria bacterium]|nr:tRNA (adenosine(37)-N6)-threonylcarbamoyltransferase complex dimerization subunit type 1 TsaB [Pseudomonadota bacterium]
MKPVLALECSSEVCSVALATADGVLERTASRPGEQLRVLFPMVMSLLEEARIEASALGRIAVAVGPGSFAGLRLAITTARTSPAMPEIPPIASAVPGFDVAIWHGLFGPAGMPPELTARINALGNAAIATS